MTRARGRADRHPGPPSDRPADGFQAVSFARAVARAAALTGGGDQGPVFEASNTSDRPADGPQAVKTGGDQKRSRAPRNAADVACVASDGSTRPMLEVLAERRRLYLQRPKAEREQAFRARCGLIAALQACTCSWPIVRAATTTEHEEWCTAHLWITTYGAPAPEHAAERGRGE